MTKNPKSKLEKEKKYFMDEIEKARRAIHYHQTIQKVAKQGLKETETQLKKVKK